MAGQTKEEALIEAIKAGKADIFALIVDAAINASITAKDPAKNATLEIPAFADSTIFIVRFREPLPIDSGLYCYNKK